VSSGAEGKLKEIFVGRQLLCFGQFSPNPDLQEVLQGVQAYKQFMPDAVIAVGGGSAIDMAKLIAFFGALDVSPQEYLESKLVETMEMKPLIAVPTTAGTGSEATHFAVLYVNKEKYSIAHEKILPMVSVVDPQFIMTMPPYVAASSGMDAFCQGIESYWSIYSTDESKSCASQAIRLAVETMVDSVNHPNRENRLAMATAAHLAGKAINITKTTAPHAVSYPMTSYFNVAHGHAVSLTISSFLVFNSEVTSNDILDARGGGYVRKTIEELINLIGGSDISSACSIIEKMQRSLGLKTKLCELGINTESDIDIIVENGFNPERVKNNPRLLTREKLREMLLNIRI
jgi:alcohol dehydrogenase class IV